MRVVIVTYTVLRKKIILMFKLLVHFVYKVYKLSVTKIMSTHSPPLCLHSAEYGSCFCDFCPAQNCYFVYYIVGFTNSSTGSILLLLTIYL